MIKPLSMMNSSVQATPVSFNAQVKNNGLNNAMNNQTQAFGIGNRELSPNIANSKLGQKLDFYA